MPGLWILLIILVLLIAAVAYGMRSAEPGSGRYVEPAGDEIFEEDVVPHVPQVDSPRPESVLERYS